MFTAGVNLSRLV